MSHSPITTFLKAHTIALSFLAILLCGCATIPLTYSEKGPRQDTVVIWAHSDIQARDAKERRQYETATDDVAKNIGYVDAAILAGDIVQGGSSGDIDDDYRWFEKTRERAPVARWYEISGNHDSRFPDKYTQYIKKPLHYAVRMGNLLMIFLSDEDGKTSGSEISDRAFEWWKDLVIKNQDKIIMTVTHTNLDNAGFQYAFLPYRNVIGSRRFEAVLEKYRVDIWISAHTHSPSKLGMNEILPGRNGSRTFFLNVASIREDFKISEVESRFLLFTRGSRTLTVKTRYHESHSFVDSRELSITLPVAFEWDGADAQVEEFR